MSTPREGSLLTCRIWLSDEAKDADSVRYDDDDDDDDGGGVLYTIV